MIFTHSIASSRYRKLSSIIFKNIFYGTVSYRIFIVYQTVSYIIVIFFYMNIFSLYHAISSCHINGIDFTYHYHLYDDIKQWIVSFIPLLHLLMSSFYLKLFLRFNHCDYHLCLSILHSISLSIVYLQMFYVTTFSATVHLFMIPSFNYFFLLVYIPVSNALSRYYIMAISYRRFHAIYFMYYRQHLFIMTFSSSFY